MKNSKKVVIVIPTLGIGGAESFAVNLSKDLAKYSDAEVFLLVLFQSSFEMVVEFDSNVKLTRLGCRLDQKVKVFFLVNRFLRLIKPDVVSTHLSSVYYVLASLYFKARVYHTVHTVPETEFSLFRRFLLRCLPGFKKLRFIVIQHKHLTSLSRIFSNVLSCIPNGSRNFSINTETVLRPRSFVMVARMVPLKRIEIAIKSFVEAKLPDESALYLVSSQVAGEEEYASNLIKLSDNHNVDLFLDVSDTSTIKKIFSNASFIINCSEYEGLPISLLEGISAGLIPVGTPTPGVCDFFIENGFEFLSKNSDGSDLHNVFSEVAYLDDKRIQELSYLSLNVFESKYSGKICSVNYFEFFFDV